MDPITAFGLALSIIQLIDATARVIKFLNDVEDAPKERAKLARETSSLLLVLTDLRYRMEEAKLTDDPWFASVRSLGVEGGLLTQLNGAIGELERKLNPEGAKKKFGSGLRWALTRNEVNNILSNIERMKSLLSLALQKDQFALSLSIKDDLSEMENGQRDQKNRDIMTWISALNFSTKQNDFFSRRQEGTGEWLLEADGFKTWLDGSERILWCPGLPGAGKTILTSIVVNYLEQAFEREDVAIAYIYCSYKEQEDQTAVNLIASLLQQLVQRRPTISDEIVLLYQNYFKKRMRPTINTWSKLLQSEVRHFSKVFILIDALDECPEDNNVRESFLNEIRGLQPRVQLFVTSRHSSTIEREFEKATRLEIHASDKDVRRYLGCRIERESRLICHVEADPFLREEIINTIVEKAKGMFLLAQLHMDSLAKKKCRRDVRMDLKNLPEELNDAYKEAMQRICSQHKDDVELAKRVLYWISYAFRQLTVTEVQHALAVDPGDEKFYDDALPDEKLLISTCAGLVTIDREGNIIRLVHYTAQEYFKQMRMAEFPGAQTNIARTCLTYMSFNTFDKGYCTSDEELESRLQRFPFLDYAARHWGRHLLGTSDQSLEILALEFLKHNSKLMCSNQVMHLPEYRYSGYSQLFPKDVTGLQIAAAFNLAEIVRLLLEKGADITAEDSDGRTTLHWAAEGGCVAVVQLLLEKGADVSAKDKLGWTALHWAAEGGHDAVVRLLLENGASMAAKVSHGWTALHRAAWSGHEAVVRLLLENGADIEMRDSYGETALYRAAEVGHEAVVRLLLEKGADIAAKGMHGLTALHKAASHGCEAVVRLLLEKGADVAAEDSGRVTALHRAAEKGHEAVVRLLLEKGANIAAKVSMGWTALHQAAWSGDEAAVRLLLENEPNISAKDSYGGTALHRAAEGGREGAVRLLLGKGADVTIRDSGGATALHRAARGGHEEVVRLLLENGADIAVEDSHGGTAMDEATMHKHEAAVRLLLEKGANIAAAKDLYGRSDSYPTVRSGREAVAQLLLEKSTVVPDLKGSYGGTALHRAAEGGHEAVVRLLLGKGADAAVKDDYGRTALQWAAENGHEAVVRLLTPLTPDS